MGITTHTLILCLLLPLADSVHKNRLQLSAPIHDHLEMI